MTPKEKAEELREKCDGYTCYALIAVDEVINQLDAAGLYTSFWYEVKQELDKL